jgi:hypothetical protein
VTGFSLSTSIPTIAPHYHQLKQNVLPALLNQLSEEGQISFFVCLSVCVIWQQNSHSSGLLKKNFEVKPNASRDGQL